MESQKLLLEKDWVQKVNRVDVWNSCRYYICDVVLRHLLSFPTGEALDN